ncbi:MAG: hypothetical protein L6265_11835 [Thermoplasmatales archaeon]|nr:hypothetical protein [Thermoplasmatales archaeon]
MEKEFFYRIRASIIGIAFVIPLGLVALSTINQDPLAMIFWGIIWLIVIACCVYVCFVHRLLLLTVKAQNIKENYQKPEEADIPDINLFPLFGIPAIEEMFLPYFLLFILLIPIAILPYVTVPLVVSAFVAITLTEILFVEKTCNVKLRLIKEKPVSWQLICLLGGWFPVILGARVFSMELIDKVIGEGALQLHVYIYKIVITAVFCIFTITYFKKLWLLFHDDITKGKGRYKDSKELPKFFYVIIILSYVPLAFLFL